MAGAGGSHGGSFAGGFIKAFLAAMQMGLRKRQIDDMYALHQMMIKQMQQNMDFQNKFMKDVDKGRDKSRANIESFMGSTGKDTGAAEGDMNYENGSKIYDYLVKNGANPEAAKGFVGGLAHESIGLKNDALNPHDPDTPSGGWGQWHGDRYDDFVHRAGSDPKKWTAEDNFNMFKHEMEDTPVGKKTMEQLRGGKSIEDGVNINTRTYEGASLDPKTVGWNNRFGLAHSFDNYISKTANKGAIPTRTSEAQQFKPYKVAEAGDEIQPPPSSQPLVPTYSGGAAPPPSGQYGYPNVGQPVGSAAPAPVAPSSGQYGYPNVGQPVAQPQVTTGRTPEMLTPTAGMTDPRLQPTPAMPSAPGTVQYNVGGVRGQQPGTGGPIYTAGQMGQPQPQPAPTLPATTGQNALVENAPIPSRGQPQQVPLSQTPMPPPRPQDFGNVSTDTSGSQTPISQQGGSSTNDPLWAGYQGASPNQAASADPFQNLYSSGDDFSASAGLTDTSGLMAAGAMPEMAGLEAEMYKGGPVIRYQRGGVIRRYAAGGNTDDDFLGEYGGTDTDDPTASALYDLQQVNQLTNNSAQSAIPDLPTSIQNREAQDQPPIQVPPEEPLTNPLLTQAPTEQPSATPTEQPTTPTEQPSATPTEQPTSQSDIPPGSVQVAGPGGYGSVGRYKDLTNIPMPRVGSMGGDGRMGYGSRGLSGGRGRATSIGASGGNPLYVPGYASDNDYNHIGIAPTTNEDGSPGVWLLNMVGNGARALFSGFGLANQGAMPGSSQQSQSLQLFGSHDSPGMLTKEDMQGVRDFYDPKHEFVEAAAEIGGSVSMIKYYALTGQLDLASRLAGGVLLYTRMMSMEYGDQAVKSLFKGDYNGAVKLLEKSHAWVPDGKTASGEVVDEKTGKVRAQLKDGNGTVLDEKDYMPAAIMEAALGARNGTSYWQFLSGLAAAGNNDALGSHYQTQQRLREIQTNKDVPLDPFSVQSKTIPIDGATPPAPSAQPPTPVDTTTPPAPDTQPDTTQQPTPAPDSTQAAPPATPTAIPPKDAGGVTTGMAVPPQPSAQPPTAMAGRGDISNLVAGPGASSAAPPQTQPTQPGGSGAYLVAQEQQAPDRVQQSQAITSMLKQGSYDPDSPYIRQKISDIDKQLAPLQQYRRKLDDQLANIEASTMNPQDKRAMQLALAAKIKDFNETTWKNALKNRDNIIRGIDTKLKEQFSMQKAAALQQQAEMNKRQDQARAYDNQRVGGEQKRQAALPPGHPQVNANDGLEADGSPLVNKVTGEHVLGYGEQLAKQLTEKDATTENYTNPIARSIQSGNPWLSASYDGTNPRTVDMSKVDPKLFGQTTLKTMSMASRDMIMMNSGDVTFRDAQDLTTNVATGAYTIQRVPHPKIHSMVLGDIDNDDGIPRTDVIINRVMGDQNPMRLTMSTDNANRLADMATRAKQATIHNRAMADMRAPAGPSYPSQPSALPSRGPISASKSDIAVPPQRPAPQNLPPTRIQPSFRLGPNNQIVPIAPEDIDPGPIREREPGSTAPIPREVPQWIIGPNGQPVPNPNYNYR